MTSKLETTREEPGKVENFPVSKDTFTKWQYHPQTGRKCLQIWFAEHTSDMGLGSRTKKELQRPKKKDNTTKNQKMCVDR